MNFAKNMGLKDRNFRYALGALIVIIGLMNHTWWGLVGVVLLATAYLQTCPAYSFLRMDTRSEGEK